MLYIFSFFKIEICNLQFCFYVPLYIIKLIIPQSVLNSSSLHIKCFSYWEKKKKILEFCSNKNKGILNIDCSYLRTFQSTTFLCSV